MTDTASLIEVDQLRELFEEAPVAYHELDTEGIVRRVNQAECALLRVSAEEVIGQPIWQFMPGGDREVGRAALARKLAGTQPLAPFRRVYVTGQGRYLTVEIHDRVMRDGSGHAIGMRSALLDVTEQVEAETALRRSQQWLTAVLRSVSDPVFAVDALGQVKFMNPAAERLTGHCEADARDEDIENILIFKDLLTDNGENTLEEHLRGGIARVGSGTAKVISAIGEEHPVRITTSPIVTDQNAIMGLTLCVRPSEGSA